MKQQVSAVLLLVTGAAYSQVFDRHQAFDLFRPNGTMLMPGDQIAFVPMLEFRGPSFQQFFQVLPIPPPAPPLCQGSVCATFSQQGAEILRQSTGKLVKGMQILDVQVCNYGTAAYSYSGGMIEQAAAGAGINYIAASLTALTLTRTAGLNWRSTSIAVASIGSAIGAQMVGAGVIAASRPYLVGLISGHGALDSFTAFERGRQPQPNVVTDSLIREDAKGTLGSRECLHGFMGAKFEGTRGPVKVVLQ